jgi:hypothetical protein
LQRDIELKWHKLSVENLKGDKFIKLGECAWLKQGQC